MMLMNYPTIEIIQKRQEQRIRRAEELLKTAKTEEEKKALKARIWMLKNS